MQSRASGTLATTSGQAAIRRSMPFDTISLPTKLTIGSRSGSSARRAADAPVSPPQPPAAPSSRSASAWRRLTAMAGGRRLEGAHTRAGRAEPRALARVGQQLPEALGHVRGADEDARRGRKPL